MHRQSLGSPAAKLHLFSAAGVITDNINTNFTSEDHRNKDKSASCSPGDDELQRKSILVSSSSTKLVHLIPLLTFLCFLILYLSSHDPSRKDLTQFSGFATFSSKKNVIDSFEIDDDNTREGFLEIEKINVLAIPNMRNLKQQERRRFHRKIGQ